MRNSTQYLFFPLLAVFLLTCQKEKQSMPETEKGILTVNVEMNIQEHDLSHVLKNTSASADSFTVEVYNENDERVLHYDPAANMPANIELPPGTYYVKAFYGNPSGVGFEKPYLSGQSVPVQVDYNEHTEATVNCAIQNCAVTIVYAQDIIDHFDTYTTEVSSTHGALTFGETENRYGYFPLSPVNIVSTLQYETSQGTEQKTLQGTIPDPLPGKLYEIILDASPDDGEIAIAINIDESLETQVIEIHEENNEWLGALVITEIMYDPDALPDNIGEWFEIYNPTDSAIRLDNKVIRRDQNLHVISTEQSVEPGSYFILARADTVLNADRYIYGTSVTLTNSQGTLGIYTYGTDGTDGKEICEVHYTAGGDFPSNNPGTAIQLSAGALDAQQAKSGANWCHATDDYYEGDLGTPGAPNSNCD